MRTAAAAPIGPIVVAIVVVTAIVGAARLVAAAEAAGVSVWTVMGAAADEDVSAEEEGEEEGLGAWTPGWWRCGGCCGGPTSPG